MRVKRLDEKINNLKLPSLLSFSEDIISENDTLILCAGFEERTLTLLEKTPVGIEGLSIIMVNYLPYLEENRKEELKKISSLKQYNLDCVSYDREEPAGAGYTILNKLQPCCNNIWIDISGMSRFLIVQLLEACIKKDLLKKVRVFYAEANTYPPSKIDVEEGMDGSHHCQNISLFLSSGVFDVTVVPELSSIALLGQPIRLVAFPSFNCNQLTSLQSVIQPAYISIINGEPPDDDNKWRKEAIRRLNCTRELNYCDEHDTSTLDYRETIKILLDIYDKYGELERIVVSPTGSKMQTVAIGILRGYLDDLQIAYPTPHSFIRPKEYTSGVSSVYFLDLSELPSMGDV